MWAGAIAGLTGIVPAAVMDFPLDLSFSDFDVEVFAPLVVSGRAESAGEAGATAVESPCGPSCAAAGNGTMTKATAKTPAVTQVALGIERVLTLELAV
jgi:hypothetical protein